MVTGEYPPLRGGVGDFSEGVARALSEAGRRVTVWTTKEADNRIARTPSSSQTGLESCGTSEIRRFDADFDCQGLVRLGQGIDGCDTPRRILIQYVPNAFGFKGMNLAFCGWVRKRKILGDDVRVVFHEPFFYFALHGPHRNLLALVQRLMAWILMRGARIVYTSTPTWERYLRPYARPGNPRFVWLPMPATLPVVDDPEAVRKKREGYLTCNGNANLFGHFGTYGTDIAEPLEALLPRLLNARPSAHFLLIGRRSDRFCTQFQSRHPQLATRVHATGDLEPREASLHIQACDVLVQPYPDGVTARRTSVINLLAHGCAVVTTKGLLTEDFWGQSKSCLLADTVDVKGIVDAAIEAGSSQQSIDAWGNRAKAFYNDTFHPHRLMQCLMLEEENVSPQRHGGLRRKGV